MKKILISTISLLVVTLFIFWGCQDNKPMFVESVNSSSNNLPLGQNGTTLSATVTATGKWIITYEWTPSGQCAPLNDTISKGECGEFSYSVTYTKSVANEEKFIEGVICVTNGGTVATLDLRIEIRLQGKSGAGQFATIPSYSYVLDLGSNEIIAAGQTRCYSYRINNFLPEAGWQYRVYPDITIMNHSGSIGTPKGPEEKANVDVPISPELINDCIDPVGPNLPNPLPEGFTVTSLRPIESEICETTTIIYSWEVCNINADCDNNYEFFCHNIYSGECSNGCALSQGYWKTHCGYNGNNPDKVGPLLPQSLGSINVVTTPQAYSILKREGGSSSNGIIKLLAQMLAAKLNIANGADGSCISSAIVEADLFLNTNGPEVWATLSKADRQMVIGWMSMFDQYNNGNLCAPHCD